MIARIGGISIKLSVPGDRASSERILEEVNGRLSGFTAKRGRHNLMLTIRPVDDLPWEEILCKEDLIRARRIVDVLRRRFPLTRIPFENMHTSNPSHIKGRISSDLLSRFCRGGVSVIPQGGFLLAVDHRSGYGEVFVKRREEGGLVPSFMSALQGALGLCASYHDALMLHASSLAIDGRGFVFIGASGAGKTTIASSVAPEAVLSDDGSWCSRMGGRFYLYRTPFSQIDTGPPLADRTPLDRLLFLGKSEHNYIAGLSPGRAMTMLLLNHIHFFRYMDREGAFKAFGLVEELCRKNRAFTLFFNRSFNPMSFFRGIIE